MAETTTKEPAKKSNTSTFITIIILLIIALGVLLFFYFRGPSDDNAQRTKEALDLKDQVGEHIILNADEEPTIATIEDVDKLKETNPDFYEGAENGDKLLLYSDRVILFDPDKDIIINVGPVIKRADIEESSDL
ncbi:hypothetical protein ACFL1U_02685 [Patescibacteria group bacterium]